MKNIAKTIKWLFLFLLLFSFIPSESQSQFYLNHFIQSISEQKYCNNENFFSIKPYDNQIFENKDTTVLLSTKISLFNNNNLQISQKDLKINFNLLADFSQTTIKDSSTKYTQNTRGFNIFGTLGKNLFFYTEFYENQV